MIEVVCAVVCKRGRYFVCQRPPNKAQALLWEFPGGKLETDESPEEALSRELHEELHWQVNIEQALPPVEWTYEDGKTIRLRPFLCSCLPGVGPQLKEHVQQAWVSLAELHSLDLCPADRPILESLAANSGR
ncbi:MAG: (deoxy)nucleoside triphosphate pyrophosphohydrolase [Oligoflexus sp.]